MKISHKVHQVKWVVQDKQTNNFLDKDFEYFTPNLDEASLFNTRKEARQELDRDERVIKVGITFETL